MERYRIPYSKFRMRSIRNILPGRIGERDARPGDNVVINYMIKTNEIIKKYAHKIAWEIAEDNGQTLYHSECLHFLDQFRVEFMAQNGYCENENTPENCFCGECIKN